MTECLIPLWARDGTIRAYALVDHELFVELNRYRWYQLAKGYAARGFRDGGRVRQVKMARQILGLKPGDSRQADHINGDRLDNRRCNLRIVSAAENSQNIRRPLGESGRRGVTRNKRGWKAHYGGHYLGTFPTIEEAAAVAAAYRAEHAPYSMV